MAYQQQQQYGQGYAPQGQNPYQQQPQWNAPPPQQDMGASPHYAEGGVPKSEFGFNDRSIRAAFVRKVFFIVAIMLAVVTVMSAIPFLHPQTMQFVRQTPMLYYVSYFTFLGVYIALMCCEGVRRSFPSNVICTAILTLAIGYMTMMITSMYTLDAVVMCLAITCLCCAGIILFSMQTKYDLTSMMGIVFIISLVIMIFGFVAVIAMIAFQTKFLYMIYAGLAALLFMFYLAIDVQMLMGGRKYEISPEDHIFASIQIFLDIVYIFWMLLTLFGNNN